jgi:hypothetical protein
MGSIELELDEAEDEERVDVDKIEIIREDVEKCSEWIASEDRNGTPPRYSNGRLVAKIFGRDDAMTAWLPLLFAAAAVYRHE